MLELGLLDYLKQFLYPSIKVSLFSFSFSLCSSIARRGGNRAARARDEYARLKKEESDINQVRQDVRDEYGDKMAEVKIKISQQLEKESVMVKKEYEGKMAENGFHKL